jgi:hypothetical protein
MWLWWLWLFTDSTPKRGNGIVGQIVPRIRDWAANELGENASPSQIDVTLSNQPH